MFSALIHAKRIAFFNFIFFRVGRGSGKPFLYKKDSGQKSWARNGAGPKKGKGKGRSWVTATEILIIPYRKVIFITIIYSYFNRYSSQMKNKREGPSKIFIYFFFSFPIFLYTFSSFVTLPTSLLYFLVQRWTGVRCRGGGKRTNLDCEEV